MLYQEGKRQRVWIAMALAQQTDLILLDEPTTYLDLAHQLEVLKLYMSLTVIKSVLLLWYFHDLNLAARFSDYIIAIQKGAIIKHGIPEEVMTPEVLRKTFNINADVVIEPKRSNRPVCITYDIVDENEDIESKEKGGSWHMKTTLRIFMGSQKILVLFNISINSSHYFYHSRIL